MLPLDMLTPQLRHYELRQKNSRYANFSDLSTPSYAIFDFFQKIPDMLILVIYLPPTMGRHANCRRYIKFIAAQMSSKTCRILGIADDFGKLR